MKRIKHEGESFEPTPEEWDGKRALYAYFREAHGRQAAIARATGIAPPTLTKISLYKEYPIGLETAMVLEIASGGKLRAAVLCPSRAELLAQFVALEAGEAVEA